MGKLKYFPAFLSYRHILERLRLDEVGAVFLGALQYAEDGTVPDLDPTPAIVLEFIMQDINRAQESYEELCAKNRANRAQGAQRPSTTVNDGDHRQRPSTTVNDGDERECNANENENEKEFSMHAPTEGTETHGRGPSLREVRDFVKQSGLNVDPDDYYDKRQRSGWRNKNGRYVGGDWQSDMRKWARYQRDPVAPKSEPVKAHESSFDTDEFFDAAVRASYAKYGYSIDETDAEEES